jgi:uridine phosphorylase
MQQLSPTDLILNPDGSVYHLGLLPHQIADTIITVGDPDRVASVSQYFDTIDFSHAKREFVTHTGRLAGKRISVLSSGMGTDNVEILLTELDALANINLHSRQVNPIHKALNIIRLGTSGSIQESLPIHSLLISRAALGMDMLSQFYTQPKQQASALPTSFAQQVGLSAEPYYATCSEQLLQIFSKHQTEYTQTGTTLTCPGFYAPQGRLGRYASLKPYFLEQVSEFRYQQQAISNLEMETAGYYLMGQVFGHHCLSVSIILANRIVNQFSEKPDSQVDNMIKWALKVIAQEIL